MTAPNSATEPDLRAPSAPRGDDVTIAVGTVIGRYVVTSRVGQGGMGVVVAAYDPQLDRRVAIKLMRASRADRLEREARRLQREAMAMARMTHPNVITVHDVGEHAGRIYIAMELVEGDTLTTRLQARPPWPVVLELLTQAGRGLAAAHARGLVHRDFKPDNVMVGHDGRVRVMDFGLAHDSRPATEPASVDGGELPPPGSIAHSIPTHAGRIAGTPGYIAPELHRGLPADARSDQFAFGVVLFEALCGTRPFDGDNAFELAAATMAGTIREEPLDRAAPAWLRQVVRRTLASDPAARFPTMDAVLEALAHGGRRGRARRRWAALAGVGAIAAGVAAAVVVPQQRARARCEREGAEIDASWNDSVRERASAAILTHASEPARASWAKAEAWLDRYAAQWRTTRTEVCLATAVEGLRSEALRDRAVACLEQRRRTFEGLLTWLVSDAGRAATAVTAASGLPAIDPCTDDAALAREQAEVDDVGARERLREAVAASLVGDDQGRVAAARQAVTAAAAAGASVVEVEARLELAAGLAALDEFDEAVAQCEQAFYLAGRTGDDRAAAAAAARAAAIGGFDRHEPAIAQRWLPLADMALARVRSHDSPAVADILHDLGRAESASGHYDAAERWLAQAREIDERELDADHPAVASVLIDLAVVALERGNFDEAELVTRQALARFEAAYGSDHPRIAGALNNLGNAYDARGEYRRALELYQQAAAQWQRSEGEDSANSARVWVNIANQHYHLGEIPQAIAMGRRALAAVERSFGNDSAAVATALNNLANYVASDGDFDAAKALLERALAIREAKLPADHPELASTLGNFGLLLVAQPEPTAADLERARTLLQRAIAIWRVGLGAGHPMTAQAIFGLGRVLAAQGDLEGAREQLEIALPLRTRDDLPPLHRAETAFELAKVLRRLGRDPERAVALARDARAGYVAEGAETFALDIEDVDAFLAAAPQ
ncbi:MAG: serine/threonine-protein kinase [Nannocystaceae bacterium]|nr:serine/threonine-protein kinase [Nannocystaceae bacterium]